MDTGEFTFIENLEQSVEAPEEGMRSHPVFTSELVRVTVFGLAAGHEMREHSTSHEALLHFLDGEAELSVGGEKLTAKTGAWLRMAPRVAHSITAKTPVKFALHVLGHRG